MDGRFRIHGAQVDTAHFESVKLIVEWPNMQQFTEA